MSARYEREFPNQGWHSIPSGRGLWALLPSLVFPDVLNLMQAVGQAEIHPTSHRDS